MKCIMFQFFNVNSKNYCKIVHQTEPFGDNFNDFAHMNNSLRSRSSPEIVIRDTNIIIFVRGAGKRFDHSSLEIKEPKIANIIVELAKKYNEHYL